MDDKILGCMMGTALGDALGATLEFMTEEQVRAKYGTLDKIIGGGWLHLKPGDVTDDTEQMLILAKHIVKYRRIVPNAFAADMITWAHLAKDVGNATKKSLDDWQHGIIPGEDDTRIGNGSIMRIAPVLVAWRDPNIGRLNAIMQSRVTHPSHEVDVVVEELFGVAGCFAAGGGPSNSPRRWAPSFDGGARNTFTNALCAIASTSSFEETLILLANKGGDADSNCAVAGALAGLKYGFQHMLEGSRSRQWIQTLRADIKAEIETLARQMPVA